MATAKSARPSRNAKISRAMHSVRTSSFACSPPYSAGTQALKKTRLAERRDARAAGLVHVVMRQAGQCRIGPARKLVGKAPMMLLEERPGECFGERHQLPSNTGFCFAANAR